MLKQHSHWLAICVAAFLPWTSFALLTGDPAPPLKVKEWVKGTPVEIKPGTNLIVLEVMATWSPASCASITNLNEVQRRYKDKGVVVVGIYDEPVETIREFLQHGEGTNIQFSVMADDEKKTSFAYMNAFKMTKVPAAFIVGTNGHLMWRGAPFHGLKATVARMTAPNYDIESDQRSGLQMDHMGQYLMLAQRGDTRTKAAGLRLLETRTNSVPLLCDLAFRISTSPGLKQRDFELAGNALNLAEKLAPTNTPQVVVARAIWLFKSGKTNEGVIMVKKAIDSAQQPQDKTNAWRYLHTMEKDMVNAGKGGGPAWQKEPSKRPNERTPTQTP